MEYHELDFEEGDLVIRLVVFGMFDGTITFKNG